jgi:chromosome segregation ATPase
MLDEVFDFGLDTVGVQLATKLVKHKTREEGLSMFVISHRDEVFSSFDSVLTVHYSKGFSTIVNPTSTAVESAEE